MQNYEEGAENTIDNGDAGGEVMLQEFGPLAPLQGERDIPMETQVSTRGICLSIHLTSVLFGRQFEYGSRAGMWRLLRLFKKHE